MILTVTNTGPVTGHWGSFWSQVFHGKMYQCSACSISNLFKISSMCRWLAGLHRPLENFETTTVRTAGPAGVAVVSAVLPKFLCGRAMGGKQLLRHLLGCSRELH